MDLEAGSPLSVKAVSSGGSQPLPEHEGTVKVFYSSPRRSIR
jgi:hypothetical protein